MDGKGKISFGFQKAVPGIGGKGFGASTSASGSKLPSKVSLFGDDDDDDDEDDDDNVGMRLSNKTQKKKMGLTNGSKGGLGVAGAAPLSRSAKQRTEEALIVDESIFDYDGVYDSMKIGEREVNAQREEEKKKRDPKYISSFLASSEQRKVDRIRSEAKMIQRERDLEGEEYAGTESFVTDAYKKQMEEMQQAELKEKEKEEKDRSKSKGVAGFYKTYMEESDRAHQAAVAASLKAKSNTNGDTASNSEAATASESNETETQKAVLKAREKGLDVRVNDDNEVVDERSLLSAGLNTFGKKKKNVRSGLDMDERDRGSSNQSDRSNVKRDGAQEAREAREAQRQRQSKMIEEQMLELERKREEEARQEEEERKRSLVKERRNDQSSVANARERALERKRKREEEEKAKADTSKPL